MRKPRKIVNYRGRTSRVGFVSSLKAPGPIWYESLIERDFIILADFDAEVTSIQHQPFSLSFIIDGKKRTYTPDFLVVRKGQRQIIEVKPDDILEDEESMDFFDNLAKLFTKRGEQFLLYTANMIRVEPKLSNIKILKRYSRFPVPVVHKFEVIRYLESLGPSSLESVAEALSLQGILLPHIYSMLYNGFIEADMSSPLGPESKICL